MHTGNARLQPSGHGAEASLPWGFLRPFMALVLGLSAGIHFAVAPQHFREWVFAGVFFVLAATVQASCAYMALRTGSRRSVAVGASVSLVLIAAWGISRTTGFPFGPAAGQPEAVGAIDTVATAAEIAMLSAFATHWRRQRLVGVRRASRAGAVALAGFTILLGSATATALPRHEHAHLSPRSTEHAPGQVTHHTPGGESESANASGRMVGSGERVHSDDGAEPHSHD